MGTEITEHSLTYWTSKGKVLVLFNWVSTMPWRHFGGAEV